LGALACGWVVGDFGAFAVLALRVPAAEGGVGAAGYLPILAWDYIALSFRACLCGVRIGLVRSYLSSNCGNNFQIYY